MNEEDSSEQLDAVLDEASMQAIDAERKYLGGLLKDRINFHLVFSSLFLLGGFRMQDKLDEELELIILAVGTLVSVLICAAVLRTHGLVQNALKAIGKDKKHPYCLLKDSVYLPDANRFLVFVPVILSLLFTYLTVSLACHLIIE